MINLCLVAGARPNFMKVAPLVRAIEQTEGVAFRLVHTGQHYDHAMNEVFFQELGIPAPDANLNCGGGSHAEQTAKIMLAFEAEMLKNRPDWVVVVGDVNSTLACAITAKKLGIKVAHVEAGLRSRDLNMPEEINRMVTDAISDLFFVTEPSARENLLLEGHPEEKIHSVGHVMIDNLFYQVAKLQPALSEVLNSNHLKRELDHRYGVVTLHRPSNVDHEPTLRGITNALAHISERLPLLFAVHPRTEANLKRFKIELPQSIRLLPPLPYMDFLNLWKDSKIVLTDSGGLQEETTALGVPCITIRENTERPVTVTDGSNRIAGTQTESILEATRLGLSTPVSNRRPPLWDGLSAQRIIRGLRSAS
jgi:UDP-N-acetylglucosamine 2-epimerase (non-hydrolysing)